ncbi:hypothetical protein LZ32DRAFT_114641 [Colletotrichum eremochloae]|nr:hypothetical protein LZ32DRAFT_114641 [Colletotrichum eremochloae]
MILEQERERQREKGREREEDGGNNMEAGRTRQVSAKASICLSQSREGCSCTLAPPRHPNQRNAPPSSSSCNLCIVCTV